MSITLQYEAKVVFYIFRMLLKTFLEKQYLFMAQWTSSIATLASLQPAFASYCSNQKFPSAINSGTSSRQQVSPIPRDTQRDTLLPKTAVPGKVVESYIGYPC
jgi:hypothetical protein